MTATLLGLSCAVPCIYPDIVGLLGILGGLTIGFSGYVVPFFLRFLSFEDKPFYHPKKFYYGCLFLFSAVTSILSVILSVVLSSDGGGGH